MHRKYFKEYEDFTSKLHLCSVLIQSNLVFVFVVKLILVQRKVIIGGNAQPPLLFKPVLHLEIGEALF